MIYQIISIQTQQLFSWTLFWGTPQSCDQWHLQAISRPFPVIIGLQILFTSFSSLDKASPHDFQTFLCPLTKSPPQSFHDFLHYHNLKKKISVFLPPPWLKILEWNVRGPLILYSSVQSALGRMCLTMELKDGAFTLMLCLNAFS